MVGNVNRNAQQDDLILRVGHITSLFHDSLRGLGLDKLLERTAEDISDAWDRLDYVARMSEKAAQRVLNATDVAIPLQYTMDSEARRMSAALQLMQSLRLTLKEMPMLSPIRDK